MSAEAIQDALLRWYDGHARELPWRALPGKPKPDPYRVWLSEIMLQQTTVAAVTPYFAKFTRLWPDVASLAAAKEADIMAAWAGLGYYARARNLHACAKAIVAKHGGQFPETESELRELPGIGAYTGAAIAAIAFGEAATVVDANVERVIARLEAIERPLPKARRDIRAFAETLTPAERAGDFAQAMMDLGATICTNRNPSCAICPLLEYCDAQKIGEPDAFPVKPKKKAKPHREGTAYWLEHKGKVLLIRRPPRGMLGGMRALPSQGWEKNNKSMDDLSPDPWEWQAVGKVDHVFTHFSLELTVVSATALMQPDTAGEWWPIEEIEHAGLPTLFAKAATLARAMKDEKI